MFDETCSGWCAPTIIYTVLALITIILHLVMVIQQNNATVDATATPSTSPTTANDPTANWINFAINVVVSFLFGGLLFALCKNCYNNAAWAILIISFIISLLLIGAVIYMIYALTSMATAKTTDQKQ